MTKRKHYIFVVFIYTKTFYYNRSQDFKATSVGIPENIVGSTPTVSKRSAFGRPYMENTGPEVTFEAQICVLGGKVECTLPKCSLW